MNKTAGGREKERVGKGERRRQREREGERRREREHAYKVTRLIVYGLPDLKGVVVSCRWMSISARSMMQPMSHQLKRNTHTQTDRHDDTHSKEDDLIM